MSNEEEKPEIYRKVIDALVAVCKNGPGQLGPDRVRAGIWNANARPDYIEDQYAINVFLAKLTTADREVLAAMLVAEVRRGVFESLKVLEEFQIAPFESGYEGSPYHDFVGRMDDWNWPSV